MRPIQWNSGGKCHETDPRPPPVISYLEVSLKEGLIRVNTHNP